jgi:hypothetical protein
MKTSTLAGLILLSALAQPAAAAGGFRPWLQAHWEVDEGTGLPTPAMTSGLFRPWVQAHWEVADDVATSVPAAGPATGEFADR